MSPFGGIVPLDESVVGDGAARLGGLAMGSIPRGDRLCRETVRAAREFASLEIWKEYSDDEIFGVRVPGSDHPIFCSILGGGGQEFGLGVFKGESALDDYRRLFIDGGLSDDVLDSIDQMSLTLDRLRDIPVRFRKFLDRAGLQARRDALVPAFLAKEPGRQGREINQTEALLFLYALRGIMAAYEANRLAPAPFGEMDDILVLHVSGDPLRPDVAARYEPLPEGALDGLPDLYEPPSPPDLDLDLLPRLEATWLVGFRPISAAIAGDDRSVRALLVMDDDSELILGTEILMGENVEGAVDAFYAIAEGRDSPTPLGLPIHVLVSSRSLFNALAPDLAAVDVDCEYDPEPGLLDQTYTSLEESIAERVSILTDIAEDLVPPPDDRQGWSVAEQSLISRLVERIVKDDLATRRARVRFFGDEETAAAFLDPEDESGALGPFFEWLLMDYRATRKSRTIAEKMLEGDLLAAHRVLLEARMRTRAGLYRVDRINPDGSVDVVDILTGERLRVTDVQLSRSAEPGLVLPARVFEAGDFRFLTLLGPALMPLEVDSALEYLQRAGLDLTPEGLERSSHFLGRLWGFLEERRASEGPLYLTNTDGDPLELQTASFAVEDEESTRQAIEARDDIEENEAESCYEWLRREPDPTLGGGETVLGRIEFVADELVLEVNSATRLLAARSWLEKIPGVTFLGRTVRNIDDEAPPDDVLSRESLPPPPPEAAEALREMFRSRHMAWLDESIPMFGGKTPREMCATEKGRARVAAAIRAMPDPEGPLGTEITGVPREDMLRELGLL
jgi:hypothetical protein